MSKLSKQQVEHIAQLARLGLSEAEKERFSGELSSILDYVGQLSKVDTANVEPITQITELTNIMFEDEVKKCEISREELLKNAPEKEDGFIKTRSILE